MVVLLEVDGKGEALRAPLTIGDHLRIRDSIVRALASARARAQAHRRSKSRQRRHNIHGRLARAFARLKTRNYYCDYDYFHS